MNICVVVPQKDIYSETFIRAHIERLAGEVTSLYGTDLHMVTADGRALLKPPGFLERVRRSFLYRLFGVRFDEHCLWQRAFQRYLTDNGIDAVLAEFGPTGVRLMESCKKADVALVVHFHGFDAYRKKTIEDYGAKYQSMFQTADAVIAVSRHMVERLVGLGAARERVHHVPCGMNEKMFYGGDPAKAGPVFLTIGRFVDKKAPHLLLPAFRKVLLQAPEARLIMVGDGLLWDSSVALAKALKIENSVTFAGVKSHQEVAHLMREVRAYVQHFITPSSGDSEGTPVAVMEAGGSGLPVIATRHAGIPDVVDDGITGFLVDEYDIDTMAERMTRIAREPALAARMGQAARERVLSQFTLDKTIKDLDEVIRQAVQKRKGTTA
ncbi:MAG: glycosyltransferase [Candidatus Omnitrophota bacterium]|nr:glycosyltransferase [Candidatus Omnitrophota bacterium]MDZ4243178.1 glycosyltransferase [Candidatus Omnitrophota bacterium]